MDVAVRVSLFHLLDTCFYQFLNEVYKRNSDWSAEDEKKIPLLCENLNPTYTPMDYSAMFIILALMMRIASPKKITFLDLTCFTFISISFLTLTFFPFFNQTLEIDNRFVPLMLLIRFAFTLCVSVCLITINIKEHQVSCTVFAVVLFYFMLNLANPCSVDYQLAKFLASGYLVANSCSQLPLLSLDAGHLTSSLKEVSATVQLFALVHALPLLQGVHFRVQRSHEWERVFLNHGFVVFRVYAAFLPLALSTALVYVGVKKFLRLKRDFHLATLFLNAATASPLFFFAFAIDRKAWAFNFETDWSFLNVYVAMHALAILKMFHYYARFTLTLIPQPHDADAIRAQHQRAIALTCFVLTSTLLILTKTWSTFDFSVQLLVVTFQSVYVVFSSLFAFFSYALDRLMRSERRHRVVYLDHLIKNMSLVNHSCYVLAMSTCMWWAWPVEGYGMSVLFGAAFFTWSLKDCVFASYRSFVRFVRANRYVRSVLKIGSERLTSLENASCAICQEKMTGSGCETECEHHFHEECLLLWLYESHKCPLCQFGLVRGFRNEKLFDVV